MPYLYLVLKNRSEKKGTLRKQWGGHCSVRIPNRKREKTVCASQLLPYLTAKVVHSCIFKLGDIYTDPYKLPHN